jgi:hypothetical protein
MQQGYDGKTLEESPSIDVRIVASYVTAQPDLSTFPPTTPGATEPVVGPSVWPDGSGNSASEAILPQVTSGPSPSAPGNNKWSAGSSLIEHELRDDGDDGNDGPPSCQPGDTNPNCNPGGNVPGPGPPPPGKGVSPPPAVVQWMQCFFWAIELVWVIIPPTVGWCMGCGHKAVECNHCCSKHCKKPPSSDAYSEPDAQNEKKLADDTPEKSKKVALTFVERRADGIKHEGESFKHMFSLVSKLMQSFGTPKAPQGPPPPC